MANNVQMERHSQKQEDGTYRFGTESKAGIWTVNHIFHILVAGTILLVVTGIPNWNKIMIFLKFDMLLFGWIFLLRFLYRNLCYGVEINPVPAKIKFFRFFNKGIVEVPIRSVEFVFDKHFACLYGGERFTIFNEYMGGIAEVLPPGMEIRFSEGLYGRFMKKQFERQRSQKRL